MKTNIKEYIKIYSNKYFPEKKCKLIINSLDISKNIPHTFYNPRTDKQEKKGDDPQHSFLKDKKIKPIGNLIKEQWYKIITAYIIDWVNKKEKMHWFPSWNGYSFPKFIEYNKGTLMTNHCDHIYSIFSKNGQARGIPILSIITALNDNYSGGEIIMCDRYEYKLTIGETIMFPSNFLYPHEIKKIVKGKRHSMVSWVY
mgnify:CR=1 FL=1